MSELTFRAGISLFTQNCSSIAQSGWASATPWLAHENMWCSTFRPGVVGIGHGFKTWYFKYHDFDGNNLVLHPGGEPLVEPEVVPPLHRHEVPKPLIKSRVPWYVSGQEWNVNGKFWKQIQKKTWWASSWATTMATHCLALALEEPSEYRREVSLWGDRWLNIVKVIKVFNLMDVIKVIKVTCTWSDPSSPLHQHQSQG